MNQKNPKDPKSILILTIKLTSVHILLEEAAYGCFDLAHTNLAHLSLNRATHLKSPQKNNRKFVLFGFLFRASFQEVSVCVCVCFFTNTTLNTELFTLGAYDDKPARRTSLRSGPEQ